MTMNIRIVILALAFLPAAAHAQEAETLIDGKVDHGGFGGPVVKFTSVLSEFGVLAGGRGGWIIDFLPEHTLVLGGGGYGLANYIDVDRTTTGGEPLYLELGYGGFEMEYVNRTNELVHFTVQLLIGAGGVDYREKDEGDGIGQNDAFFALEPGVNLDLNVTHFFRIGGGVSYRYLRGVDLDAIGDADVSGVAGQVTFKFGSF
jgi:hypothetical protein